MRDFKPETIELLEINQFDKLNDRHYFRRGDTDEEDDLEVYIIGDKICFERCSIVDEKSISFLLLGE